MIKYCATHGIKIETSSKRSRSAAVINEYQQRQELSEKLKKLSPQKFEEILKNIQKLCPLALFTEDKAQIKINALDSQTFESVLK